MDLLEAIKARHAVRQYTDKKIEGEVENQLRQIIEECNHDSGLKMQICLNEPEAFRSVLSFFGNFRNVKNYIALVGKPCADSQEKCGYYGEKIVLKATQLGLNTCWVTATFSRKKSAAIVGRDEKIFYVISVGYGVTNGVPHKVKPIEELCRVDGEMPDWFRKGMEAAQLAPTAMVQQKFLFELRGNIVKAIALPGSHTEVDLGIVKYHFEIGAGEGNWKWSEETLVNL